MVTRMPNGQLDLTTCPRCGSATHLSTQTSDDKIIRLWWCDLCDGWWRQVGTRDATWVPQFNA